ncbi:hypothetical protein AB0C06_03830 [Micromonospora inaquosa]
MRALVRTPSIRRCLELDGPARPLRAPTRRPVTATRRPADRSPQAPTR